MQPLLARLGFRRILWLLAFGWMLVTAFVWKESVAYSGLRFSERTASAASAAQQQAELATANLNQRLIQARSVAMTLAMDPSVAQMFGRFGPNIQASSLPQPERAAVWLSDPAIRPVADRLPDIVERFGLNTVLLVNAAGDTLAEGHAPDIRPFVGNNYSDREYFKAAQQGQLGRQFAIGRATNVYGLFLSAPVQIRGQFVGMVGVGLSVSKLGVVTEKLDALVTDDLGVIVLARDPGLLMQTMPGATVANLSPRALDVRYERTDFQAASIQPRSTNGLIPLFTLTPGGGPHIIQDSATDDGSLRVYVLHDMTDAFKQTQRDQLWQFALLSLFALLTAVLIGSALNYVIRTRENATAAQDRTVALAREARTDELTGCANRRHFMQILALESERTQRFNLHFCVLSLDLDHFKLVNDTYGHAAGDQVLKHFVATVRQHLRDVDTLGRVGGEEFSVLLPQTTTQGGIVLAERIRAAVAATPAFFGATAIPITVSIGGVNSLAVGDQSLEKLLSLADEAMYLAKNRGRNRVEWTTPSIRLAAL